MARATVAACRFAASALAPTRELAKVRLAAAGIPLPPLLLSAEDAVNGKPAPDGFLLAAERLGVAPGDCLVFEDAPAGIAAAEAAGCDVVVVTATHGHPLDTTHPTIAGYEDLSVSVAMDLLTLVGRHG